MLYNIKACILIGALFRFAALDLVAAADVAVIVDRNVDQQETAEFKFERVPLPSKNDAGNVAKIRVFDGSRDRNGADVACLNDGALPNTEDSPRDSFFFQAGSKGGRLLFEFEKAVQIQQVNTYSWHHAERGPQVYKIYGGNGDGPGFKLTPQADEDPSQLGWKLLAAVDTRPAVKPFGGQYAVTISAPKNETMGEFRYLLFDVATTETDDRFGHTFFSEIDILDGNEYAPAKPAAGRTVLKIDEGYEIMFDTTDLPEIQAWLEEKLMPICKQWYPKIVAQLPSENFEAPTKFSIVFHRNMEGVANTVGTQVNCAGNWFLRNLNGEATGAVVHELVHVVQQYGQVRGGQRNPGWLVEGIADQVRWFQYEPADQRPKVNPARANYTDSYRTTAAFLDYVAQHHEAKIVTKLNADMRQGKYNDDVWKKYTGHDVEALWQEFVKSLR